MPWSILDRRIVDLALLFPSNPNDAILSGFRRLEDVVRQRIDSKEHGAKLFSQAFLGENSKLCWKDVEFSEQTSRGQLFVGTFGAFRNPKAHRENAGLNDLAEFIALNQLYLLEVAAVDRPVETEAAKDALIHKRPAKMVAR
jgi:hypothetical protein